MSGGAARVVERRSALRHASRSLTLLALLGFAALPAHAAPITQGNGPGRSSWYPEQAALSPSIVSGSTFGQLFSSPVQGQIFAQPLVWRGAVLVVTEANQVYSLDAESGAQLWSVDLGPAWDPSVVGCADILPTIGVTGTPVIDDATGVAYFVSKTYASGRSGPAAQLMHALDLQSGEEQFGFPVLLQGNPSNAPAQSFFADDELQRPGLLLEDGVVYAAFGGHCDHTPYDGYIIGVSTTGAITELWSARAGGANDWGDGIWMSGSGLAADSDDSLLFVTGNAIGPNGSPSAPTPGAQPPASLGESVVRAKIQADGTLRPTDFFTPYDALALDNADVDFGSGGLVLLPPAWFGTTSFPNLAVTCGKEGYLYLLDLDALGGCQNGPGGADAALARIGPNGGTWSSAGVWPGDGGWIYLVPNGGSMNGFHAGLGSDGKPMLIKQGASAESFGFGSSTPVVTSDQTRSGTAIVWVNWLPDGSGLNAQLRAYSPLPVAGRLPMIFSAPIGTASKFAPPGVGQGRIYVGTRDGHLRAFGSPVGRVMSGSPLQFGPTPVGSSTIQSASVQVLGAIQLASVSVSGAGFAEGPGGPTVPAAHSAGDLLTIPIQFAPGAAGLAAGTLQLVSPQGTLSLALAGSGQASGPLLAASGPSISLGGAAVGRTATAGFSLTNFGSAALRIGPSSLPAAPFTLTGAPALGLIMQPQASLDVSVTFSPTAPGQFTDTFTVQALDMQGGDAGSVSVQLSGSAATAGGLLVDPGPLDFGVVDVGSSKSLSFQVRNIGASPIAITRSKPPAQGQFLRDAELFEGTHLAPGAQLSLAVVFAPTGPGLFHDHWSLDSDGTGGLQNIDFTGVGHNPGLTTIPSPIAGGWQLNGQATLLGSTWSSLLELTPNAGYEVGSAFWPEALATDGLQVSFDATLAGGSGADGLALVLADPSRGALPTALGADGNELGFGGTPGVAIALDTWQNASNPSNNFLGISDGAGVPAGTLHWLATASNVPSLRGAPVQVAVQVHHGLISVALNGAPALTNVAGAPARALLGFSGATGGLADLHAVANVQVALPSPLTPPTIALAPADGTIFDSGARLVATAAPAPGTTLRSLSIAVDGTPVGSSSVSPLVVSGALDGRAHAQVTATALDADGASSVVTVALTNSGHATALVSEPVDGALVSGQISASAEAFPPLGSSLVLQSLALLVDGVAIGSQAGSPLTANWDSTAANNGSEHPFVAQAILSDGSRVTSSPATVLVENPPALALLGPRDGATVLGLVDLGATAQAPRGTSLGSIVLRVDGTPLATCTTAPCHTTWDTTRLLNGSAHTLSAEAVDVDGTRASSATSAIVENPPAVSISSPADGATISGAVQLLVEPVAAFTDPLLGVTLQLDGVQIDGSAGAPLHSTWDTSHALDGRHTLMATATARSGLVASAAAQVQVDNDFSIDVAAPPQLLAPGGSLSATLHTSASGAAVPLVLEVDDLPIGVTATLGSSRIAAGQSTELSLQAGDDAQSGTFHPRIIGTSEGEPAGEEGSFELIIARGPAAQLSRLEPGAPGIEQLEASAQVDLIAQLSTLSLFDGSTLLGSSGSTPLRLAWNTRALSPGLHTLVAQVEDSLGQSARSAPLQLVVEQPALSLSPGAVELVAGGAPQYLELASSAPRGPTALQLDASGLPDGVTASFLPQRLLAGASSTLALRAGLQAAPIAGAVIAIAATDEQGNVLRVQALLSIDAPATHAGGCASSDGSDLAALFAVALLLLARQRRRGALFGLAAALMLAPPLHAAPAPPTPLARIHARGELLWAGDLQGGEPYVFRDPRDPAHLVGFEVELAEALAKQLGVRPHFVQNDWHNLVPSLERGDFDLALNGLEDTPALRARALETQAYAGFREQLVVRRGAALRSLAALHGARVGTLSESLAHQLLRGSGVEVVLYEGQDEPYADLLQGRLSGVLLDSVIAERYGLNKPGLELADGDVARGRYVMAVRKGEEELRDSLDAALSSMRASGALGAILQRWKIEEASIASGSPGATVQPTAPRAGEPAASIDAAAESPEAIPAARFDLAQLLLFARGAGITLLVTFLAMALAAPLGLLLALARLYGARPLRALASTYIELIRGTPVLLQLYLLYYGISPIVHLSALGAAVLGLGLNYGAYEAEVHRAALGAVPAGQSEAAAALGLSRAQILRLVLLPQSLRTALPAMTNDLIALLKDSSLISVITVVELTKQMTITAVDVRSWALPGFVCAAFYFVLSWPLGRFAARLEERLAGSEKEGSR